MTDINADQLAHTAVFGDGDAKADARRTIHMEARRRGAVSSSIYPLYMAFGRNEIARRFTVPAFNIRALTYDAARALFRVAMRHDVGAFIFEIARSEIGYTEQRPAEYADGLKRLLGGITGISKISVQTGTSHGGVPLPDGTIAQAKIDFDVLRETTHICREEYGMAGAVQHGASTLPESVFNHFPESE